MKHRPVFMVNDDPDDRMFVKELWEELKFDIPIQFFENGELLLEAITQKHFPFIIISDLRLPKLSGLELKKKLTEIKDIKYQSIPYIIWTGNASEEQIKEAYDLAIHGIFIKEPNFEEMKKTFTTILSYWMKSKIPKKD